MSGDMPNDFQKCFGINLFNNSCVHLATHSIIDAKDDRFPSGASTSYSTDSSGSEVTFVTFEYTLMRMNFLPANLKKTKPDSLEHFTHGVFADSSQSSNFRSFHIYRKISNNVSKLSL